LDDSSESELIELLEFYKLALTEGLKSQKLVGYINSIMTERWTESLENPDKDALVYKLNKISSLWNINKRHKYTIERIDFLFHSFQTTPDLQTAFHEVLELLTKTSTIEQLSEALNECFEDKDTLRSLIQHVNLDMLQKVKHHSSEKIKTAIEREENFVISTRARDIYNHYTAKVNSNKIIEYFEKHGLDKRLNQLIYQLCSRNSVDVDILSVYEYGILNNSKNLLSKLLMYSSSIQIEYVYDKLVLMYLIEEKSNENPHYRAHVLMLGRMIYQELKYRIDLGVSTPIYASDVKSSAKIWSNRFAYFDKIHSKNIGNIIDRAIFKIQAGDNGSS
jgi:hypothetical protein